MHLVVLDDFRESAASHVGKGNHVVGAVILDHVEDRLRLNGHCFFNLTPHHPKSSAMTSSPQWRQQQKRKPSNSAVLLLERKGIEVFTRFGRETLQGAPLGGLQPSFNPSRSWTVAESNRDWYFCIQKREILHQLQIWLRSPNPS